MVVLNSNELSLPVEEASPLPLSSLPTHSKSGLSVPSDATNPALPKESIVVFSEVAVLKNSAELLQDPPIPLSLLLPITNRVLKVRYMRRCSMLQNNCLNFLIYTVGNLGNMCRDSY